MRTTYLTESRTTRCTEAELRHKDDKTSVNNLIHMQLISPITSLKKEYKLLLNEIIKENLVPNRHMLATYEIFSPIEETHRPTN